MTRNVNTKHNRMPGDVYRIGEYDMILLKEADGECHMVTKEFYGKDTVFDSSANKYGNSEIDKMCQKFAQEIEAVIGSENVIEYAIDYTSSDGSKKYKPITRKASLMTLNMFKEFKDVLKEYNPKRWWWLATPWIMTDYAVSCVSPSGSIVHHGFSYRYYGVRPFCILKSSFLDLCDEHPFNKANLRTGDVVLQRNGIVQIVNRELGMFITPDGWNDMDKWRDDLTRDRDFDILAVRRPSKKRDCQFKAFDLNLGTLVYERDEYTEL